MTSLLQWKARNRALSGLRLRETVRNLGTLVMVSPSPIRQYETIHSTDKVAKAAVVRSEYFWMGGRSIRLMREEIQCESP